MRVETSGGGSSAATILGIVFVALKLTNVTQTGKFTSTLMKILA